MPPELLYLLRRQIRASGPLRFDEFMDLVLYSHPHGYYLNTVPGADADYQTSPTLTPWFGRLVAQDLKSVWEGLGSPAEFTVVEAGAGNGDLAHAAADAAEGAFDQALRWTFVERSDAVTDLQRSRFGLRGRFSWVKSFDELEPVTGVILAHEVLDNFPFRLFEVVKDGAMEVRVGATRDHLTQVLFPIGPEVADLVAPALEHLEEGDRFELRTGVETWVAEAAFALQRGRLMVIDYGDLEPEIWTRHPSGSMVTYRRGQLGTDPFENLGAADITAHVNFSALGRAAQDASLELLPLQTQRGWLESLGLKELVAELRRLAANAQAEGRHGDYLSFTAQRSKVEMLAARGGLGDYLVFTAGKKS
jgi:SAM-dependent MidA family methyltransferase